MNNESENRITVGDRITIYPRGRKRRYVADFHYNGQHCRKSLGTANKRIALRRAIKLESELNDGSYVAITRTQKKLPSAIAIVDAVSEFIAFSTSEGRRRRTVVKQQGILNRFMEFAAGKEVNQLLEVDLRLIDAYRASRASALSGTSMHNEAQLLKQFLTWCSERQFITGNPLASRKFRPPKAKPRQSPSLEQINLILKAASPNRRPVLAALAFTGTRSGEVAHLRVDDVDLSGNWLHIESRPGFETKTGESRKLPIHARLKPILQRAVANRKSGWLFTAMPSRKYPDGGHFISTKHVSEDFGKVLKKLKIAAGKKAGFTVHSLRGSFKTICVNAGIPREVVDVWQGHAHVRNASDVYYALSDPDSQKFMKSAPFGPAE